MTKEQEEFLRHMLNEYEVGLEGQPPNERDYLASVEKEARTELNPLRDLDPDSRGSFARKVFLDREIREVERVEISAKARDGEANLNNRRYVDGSF